MKNGNRTNQHLTNSEAPDLPPTLNRDRSRVIGSQARTRSPLNPKSWTAAAARFWCNTEGQVSFVTTLLRRGQVTQGTRNSPLDVAFT
jgi:hypothetical protein